MNIKCNPFHSQTLQNQSYDSIFYQKYRIHVLPINPKIKINNYDHIKKVRKAFFCNGGILGSRGQVFINKFKKQDFIFIN